MLAEVAAGTDEARALLVAGEPVDVLIADLVRPGAGRPALLRETPRPPG